MKVVPFYLRQTQTHLSITKLTVFLSNGGKTLWQPEDQILTEKQLQEEYLEPNGFVWTRIVQTPTIWYVEIDPEKTPLHEFYTWEECQTQRAECWRSFYLFQDPTGSDWFSGKQLSESEIEGKSIHTYYEEILTYKGMVAS